MTRAQEADDVLAALREPRWRKILSRVHYIVDGDMFIVRLDCGHYTTVTRVRNEDPFNSADCLACE